MYLFVIITQLKITLNVFQCVLGQLVHTVTRFFFFAFCPDHALARLVQAYRAHGHKAAKINPLLPQKPVADSVPEIDMLTGTIRGQLNTSGN